MNFQDGKTYSITSSHVLLPTPGATYKTVKSFSGGTWSDSNIAVKATVGDVWSIYNNTTGPMKLVVASGQTMNGTVDEIFVLRKTETVEVEVVSGGYTIVRQSDYGTESFESSDGTLADCEAQAPLADFSGGDKVEFLGMTDTSLNGIYRRDLGTPGSEEDTVGAWTQIESYAGDATPTYTSQIVGTSTLNLTSGFATVNLSTTDLDGSGSDYTITLASDRIEFDNTDGTKTYKVTYSMDLTSGSILAPIEMRAELDNVLVSRSGSSIELAANQEATITKSFVVTPPTSASNNNYLDFLARQNDASADGAVVEILVLVERVV